VPAHQDHFWPGSYLKLGLGGAIAHFLGDLFPSVTTVSAAYNGSVELLGNETEDDGETVATNSSPGQSDPDPTSGWWRRPVGNGLLYRYYIRPFDYNDPFRGTGFCDASNTCH
jgi:hypothetical protein